MRSLSVVVLIAASLIACGKPSPEQECQSIVNESCKKLFQCAPTQAQTLGYTSQSDCQTKQAQQLNCANAVASCNYDANAVNKCLSDYDALSCSATSAPASCSASTLCPGNQVGCSSVGSTSSGTGCTDTWSNCTDGHTYGASCDSISGAATCTCRLDGVAGKTFSVTATLCNGVSTSQAQPIVQQNCGYTFY